MPYLHSAAAATTTKNKNNTPPFPATPQKNLSSEIHSVSSEGVHLYSGPCSSSHCGLAIKWLWTSGWPTDHTEQHWHVYKALETDTLHELF